MSLTRSEAVALLSLSTLLIIGFGARYVQQRAVPVPVGSYDEMDRLFFERSAASAEEVADEPSSSAGTEGAPGTESGSGVRGESDARASEGAAMSSSAAPRAASSGETAPLRVDINKADQAQLETLPRVGPATARRILAFRADYGPFMSVEDLQQIRGIGEKTVEQLRPHVYASEPLEEPDLP